jgi:hypothetical protein
MKYLRNIFIGFDQLLNAIAGGDPDMTVSSRLGRNYRGSWLEKAIDYVFGENHCENSDEAEKDEGRDAIIALKKSKRKKNGIV